ncbi:MAG: endonuclease/exonuclease/phosphatase family protein [Bacteroidia bacterium]|nr:endonuclease/exonuclease/phosphatase family protein [Bacteroidia bacterium]
MILSPVKSGFVALAMLLITTTVFAQKDVRVGFWNVENLYDTIDDPSVKDEEFLPSAKNAWTSARYKTKQKNTAQVIAAMNPDILGMAEVENRRVLNDLVKQPALKKQKYGIVHYDSPDQRGIDVALIYKTKVFTVLSSASVKTQQPSDTLLPTRNILVVRGVINKKDTVTILVNHWPSRRGGKDDSEQRRVFAAATVRYIVDSLNRLYPNGEIVSLGDFNDEPTDVSIQSLTATGQMVEPLFANLMDTIDAKGEGTHYYKKEKSCLDQIMVSPALLEKKTYYVCCAMIFKPEWIFAEVYKGDGLSPKRTWAGSRYIGGYSDHLPVYCVMRFNK